MSLAGGLGSLPAEVSSAAYDVVLCQGVLMYLREAGPALAELAGLVAPGGLLSLVFRNAEGIALRPALRRDWAEVQALLDAATDPNPMYRNEIGVDARADRLADVERELQPARADDRGLARRADRDRRRPTPTSRRRRTRPSSRRCWRPRSGSAGPIPTAGSRRWSTCSAAALR